MLSDEVELIRLGFETSRDGDTYSCFNSVAGEHPDLNAGSFERINGSLNVLLKFVFNSTDANKIHIKLDLLQGELNFLFSVTHRIQSLVVRGHEFLTLFLSQYLLCKDECP